MLEVVVGIKDTKNPSKVDKVENTVHEIPLLKVEKGCTMTDIQFNCMIKGCKFVPELKDKTDGIVNTRVSMAIYVKRAGENQAPKHTLRLNLATGADLKEHSPLFVGPRFSISCIDTWKLESSTWWMGGESNPN